MKISEVIKKLQEIQADKGDVEVLAMFDTHGEGEWESLEDSGISFDRLMKVKTYYTLVGNGIQERQANKEPYLA